MADIVFQLSDGSATLDFMAGTYVGLRSSISMPPPSKRMTFAGEGMLNDGAFLTQSRYELRTVEFDVRIVGTSIADLQTKQRTLQQMVMVTPKDVATASTGTAVTLIAQLGTSATANVSYTVVDGEVRMPNTWLNQEALNRFHTVPAHVRLLCQPLGRLPAVEGTGTLENEIDGATALNYYEFTALQGNEAAILSLRLEDVGTSWTTGSWNGTMWIGRMSGAQATLNLVEQGTSYDATGATSVIRVSGISIAATYMATGTGSASQGTVASFRWTQSTGTGTTLLATGTGASGTFISMGYLEYQFTGTAIPQGLFRVLLRARPFLSTVQAGVIDRMYMGFGAGFSYGTLSETPTATAHFVRFGTSNFDVGTFRRFETLDLGIFTIPPASQPTGTLGTNPTYSLRIHPIWAPTGVGSQSFGNAAGGTGQHLSWDIDYAMLFPTHEASITISNLASADRILVDGQSENPQVYILNASNVVLKVADHSGAPFAIGPTDTRVYVVKADEGDPSAVQTVVTPVYIPQVVQL